LGCGGVAFLLGFCEIGCADVVFLRGKRGEVVVICMAGRGGKSAPKNGTGF
jgi:hypothetical protein